MCSNKVQLFYLQDKCITFVQDRPLAHSMAYVLLKTVSVMQSASLCLTCTPAEELAVALRTLLRPLAILRVPVNEIGGCFGLFVAPHQPLRCLLYSPSHHTMTSTRFDVDKVCECRSVCSIVETLPLTFLPH